MGLMGKEAASAIVEALELPIEPEDYISAFQQLVPHIFHNCAFLPGQLNCCLAKSFESLSISFFFCFLKHKNNLAQTAM